MECNEKTTSAPTLVVEKEYKEMLENGTGVKFSISAEIENYSPEDFHEFLDSFAAYSRNFYLYAGRKILKEPL